jgi:hypothetical protein
MKNKKTLSVALLIMFTFFSKGSFSQEDKYVKIDNYLKKAIASNPDLISMMSLFDFVKQNNVSIDIYGISKEEGSHFIPQDELAILLYNKYIEQGFLPIIAVLETNKQFLDAIAKSEK